MSDWDGYYSDHSGWSDDVFKHDELGFRFIPGRSPTPSYDGIGVDLTKNRKEKDTKRDNVPSNPSKSRGGSAGGSRGGRGGRGKRTGGGRDSGGRDEGNDGGHPGSGGKGGDGRGGPSGGGLANGPSVGSSTGGGPSGGSGNQLPGDPPKRKRVRTKRNRPKGTTFAPASAPLKRRVITLTNDTKEGFIHLVRYVIERAGAEPDTPILVADIHAHFTQSPQSGVEGSLSQVRETCRLATAHNAYLKRVDPSGQMLTAVRLVPNVEYRLPE